MGTAAVLLHPHPSYGGDKHNIVIEALWHACAAADIAAVRFDFESDDIARCGEQAIAALGELPDDRDRYLVGYSFGAIVAATIDDPRLRGWVLIAPTGATGAAPIAADQRPKLVLVPEHDQFGEPDLRGWNASTAEPVTGADHFLTGSTAAIADRVVSWLTDQA